MSGTHLDQPRSGPQGTPILLASHSGSQHQRQQHPLAASLNSLNMFLVQCLGHGPLLQPHRLHHAELPCASLSPWVYWNTAFLTWYPAAPYSFSPTSMQASPLSLPFPPEENDCTFSPWTPEYQSHHISLDSPSLCSICLLMWYPSVTSACGGLPTYARTFRFYIWVNAHQH